MSSRAPTNSLEDALRALQEKFETATRTASNLRGESQRVAAQAERLSSLRQAGAASLAEVLSQNRGTLQLAVAETGKGNDEIPRLFGDLGRAKENSLVQFTSGGAKLVESAMNFAESLERDLGDLDDRLCGVGVLADKRRQGLLRHLQGTAEFFSLLDRGQREFHLELSRLQNHYAGHVEIRKQRKLSSEQTTAVQATEAGCRALHSGNLDRAEAHFRVAHELCPSPAALFNLALVLIVANKPEPARQLLLDPALSQCDPVEAQALKALRALQAEDYRLALTEAEAGLHIRPDHTVLRSLAATAALAANSAAAAFQHLSETDAAMLKDALAESSASTNGLFLEEPSARAVTVATGPG